MNVSTVYVGRAHAMFATVRRITGIVLLVAIFDAPTGGVHASAAEPPTAATSSSDARQSLSQSALRAYVLGRYEEALRLYLDLYVQDSGHPEHLRRIGRCQQKLGQTDRASENYREYLRKAKNISAADRAEVNGYLNEIASAPNSTTPATVAPSRSPAPSHPVGHPQFAAPPAHSNSASAPAATIASPSVVSPSSPVEGQAPAFAGVAEAVSPSAGPPPAPGAQVALAPAPSPTLKPWAGRVDFSREDAERATFSGGRLVVEILSSAVVGSAAAYGTLRLSCGDKICLGGALAGLGANILATPLTTLGIGRLMGGRGTFSAAFYGALAGMAVGSTVSGTNPTLGLALGVALMPLTAPLCFEISSNFRAREMKATVGLTSLVPVVVPLANREGVFGVIGGFAAVL